MTQLLAFLLLIDICLLIVAFTQWFKDLVLKSKKDED